MKFLPYTFWKHRNCMDVFIQILSQRTDYHGITSLNCDWYTQGMFNYWPTIEDSFVVKPEEYDNWMEYEPKGKPK